MKKKIISIAVLMMILLFSVAIPVIYAYVGETAVTYKGSRNNYLENLAVSGYELTPGFNKTNNTYFLTVANDVTSVQVTATKEDSDATATVSGNTNLKVGRNKVLISVLAENGDVRYYRIYVTREG